MNERWVLVPAVLAWVSLPHPASAQAGHVHGRVVASESAAPLVGAVVTAVRSRRSASTDRLGHFSIWIDQLPDTLVAAFIGRLPDSVAIQTFPAPDLRVALVNAPARLTDITVTAPTNRGGEEITSLGTWQLSMAAVRAVPPAIESDVFRALSLVPAVSFSTPLSARPIIRGYDPSESSMRIDGHEVLNLYHIGRAFSAFPVDAAQQVSVSASPPPVSEGGALAGIIDVTGRGGSVEGTDGGVDLSLVSASAWVGHGSAVGWFGAARAVHLSTINAVTSHTVPYNFQDFYANAVITGNNGPRGRITAFASRDHLLDRSLGSGMDWNNLLLGSRWQLITKGATTLTVTGSGTRFAQDVRDIAARGSRLDLTNRFARLSTGMELGVRGRSSSIVLGSSIGLRRVSNSVIPLSGEDFQLTDLVVKRIELGGYAEWSQLFGSAAFQLGARLDASGPTRVLQPRARFQMPLNRSLTLAAGVGRTGRLHHLVSDPQSEPDIAFYDFWLSAGEGGVPVPMADHASVDLDGQHRLLAWRLSGYVSRARGLVELRPSSEPANPGGNQFRYGRGRTAGLEVQVGLRSKETRGSSFSLIYALGRSERNWGSGWLPWSQDHRQLLRAFGHQKVSRRWTIFGAFEATSGIPLTPVEQVIFINDPGAGDSGSPGTPAYLYGRENSGRGIGTARADLGARFEFKGFGRSRAALGISVINLGFGPVAPVAVASPFVESGPPGQPDVVRVRYDRLFDLPAIPTVTLRMEF